MPNPLVKKPYAHLSSEAELKATRKRLCVFSPDVGYAGCYCSKALLQFKNAGKSKTARGFWGGWDLLGVRRGGGGVNFWGGGWGAPTGQHPW